MLTSVTSGANAAVTVTLIGKPFQRHHIHQITWSYDDAPAAAAVLTASGLEGDNLGFNITAGGPGGLALPPSSYGKVNTNVVVTLGPGGSGVTGKLNVFWELE